MMRHETQVSMIIARINITCFLLQLSNLFRISTFEITHLLWINLSFLCIPPNKVSLINFATCCTPSYISYIDTNVKWFQNNTFPKLHSIMEFSICAFFTFKNQYNQETSNAPHLKSTSSLNWRDVLKNLQDKEIILAATWATWLRNRCWFYVYFSCLGSRRCWRTDSIFYFSGHGHECLLYICCVFGWRLQEWNAQLVCILLQILRDRKRSVASWFHER